MKVKEMIKIMTVTKNNIYEAQKASSPYFHDEIWKTEMGKMEEDYPEISSLSLNCFRWLWAKA